MGVLSNVVSPFSKKKLLVTSQNFKKTLKNVTKPNPLLPRTKKVDVLVKPAHSLLNLVSKPWKPNLKKPNRLPLHPTTNMKMPKENARSLKVTWNVFSNVLKNSKANHVILKPKSANLKVRLRKLKPSPSKMPKKKTNSKPRSPAFRKNSNCPTPEPNSPKDLLINLKLPSMVFLNLSWLKR